jgi:hypothetical protein
MSAPCGTWSVVATTEDGELLALPLRCRSWSCAYCAPRLRRRLRARLSGAPSNTLITLTCRPALFATPEDAFRAMSAAVPVLIKRLRRRFRGQALEYFLVWELTRAGWPHLHMLFRGPYVPKTWLSEAWADLTGAYIVDLRYLHGADHAVNYVSKYLSKSLAVPFGCKRYRASHGYFDAPGSVSPLSLYATLSWSRSPLSLADLAQLWFSQGYGVHYWQDGVLQGGKQALARDLLHVYELLKRDAITVSPAWAQGLPE